MKGARAEGEYREGDRYDGSMRCFLDHDGRAVLDWTDESARVHALAVRSDGDDEALFRVWGSFGPVG